MIVGHVVADDVPGAGDRELVVAVNLIADSLQSVLSE